MRNRIGIIKIQYFDTSFGTTLCYFYSIHFSCLAFMLVSENQYLMDNSENGHVILHR